MYYHRSPKIFSDFSDKVFLNSKMTQEYNEVAEIYKQINKAELQANTVENMLDRLDCKMEEILKNYESTERPPSRQEPVTEKKEQ